jgi:hypothetical protein
VEISLAAPYLGAPQQPLQAVLALCPACLKGGLDCWKNSVLLYLSIIYLPIYLYTTSGAIHKTLVKSCSSCGNCWEGGNQPLLTFLESLGRWRSALLLRIMVPRSSACRRCRPSAWRASKGRWTASWTGATTPINTGSRLASGSEGCVSMYVFLWGGKMQAFEYACVG